MLEARQAVADKFSTEETKISPDHVFFSFGCSGALFNTMSVLCEIGDNVLVPCPGFPLALPISQNINIELKQYNLLPEQGWQIDLEHLKSQIDSKTKAILVNNPSNPCGSCFTRQHMEEIIAVADEFKLPIIADEVYHGLSYDPERPFVSFGNLSKNVPVIACGAISKVYCLPGWRCGWSIVYNNHGYFDDVIDAFLKHSMILLHPNTLVQASLPKILREVPQEHMDGLRAKLLASSTAAFNFIKDIRGVTPIKPSAAMYMMIKIEMDEFEGFEDDVDFCHKLLLDQNCLTFPSKCFFQKGFFRIIICTKVEILKDFAERLQTFCDKHYKK